MNEVKVKPLSLFTLSQKSDVVYLQAVCEKYVDAFGKDVAEGNKDYVKIRNQLEKLVDAAEHTSPDYSKMGAAQKREFVKDLLDTEYRQGFGEDGTKMIVRMVDEEHKIVEGLSAKAAIADRVEDAIVKGVASKQIVIPPQLVKELGQYWMYYGAEMPTNLVAYAGFDDEPWAYGRSLVKPEAGKMPTWTDFLSRLNDPEAFAAWVYGVASQKYKGRQVLWMSGASGEDGKTFVQKIICNNVFYKSDATITNTAMSGDAQRFAAAAFENKAIAVWGDCNNQMALMSEFVKQISGGSEGDKARIERKGKDSYDKQLSTRLWINSNFDPMITNDNFARSRLLYISVAPLTEAPDITLKSKFVEELPAFLEYGKICYDKVCTDQRKIKQVDEAMTAIDGFTQGADSEYEAIFETKFEVGTKLDTDYFVTVSSVSQMLKREGIKKNIEQNWFYTWLEKTHGYVRVTTTIKNGLNKPKSTKIIRGLKFSFAEYQ